MNKPGSFLKSLAAILLLAIIYERLPAPASDKHEAYPEFETTSEVIMNYRDSSGENYTIEKITYINRPKTRSGYHRLNIASDKNGYIYGDGRSFCAVKSVFYLGSVNDESYIYSVIYCNGEEFLALSGNYGTRFLEYTEKKHLDTDYLAEQYHEKCFEDLFLYLTQNAEEVNDKYLSEQIDDEKINEFIETVSLLYTEKS